MDLLEIQRELVRERDIYFKSKDSAKKGRYYVLYQIINTLEEFKRGFDGFKVKQLLATLGKVKISDVHCLQDLLEKKVEFNGETIFKIPVFAIAFEHDVEDLLIKIYNVLYAAQEEWRCIFTRGELERFELVKAWKEKLLKNEKVNFSSFNGQNVYFGNRSVISPDPRYLEARIQEYISKSSLEHEARLPAFRFICRSGGEMTDLLTSVLHSEFKNLQDFKKICNRQVNWTYDSKKNPICKTELEVDIKQEKVSDSSDQSKRDTKLFSQDQPRAKHDARIFSVIWQDNRREPDLIIKSHTELKWIDSEIIPDIGVLAMSGRYADMMPLMYQFN